MRLKSFLRKRDLAPAKLLPTVYIAKLVKATARKIVLATIHACCALPLAVDLSGHSTQACPTRAQFARHDMHIGVAMLCPAAHATDGLVSFPAVTVRHMPALGHAYITVSAENGPENQ